jgi:hypothetical protein
VQPEEAIMSDASAVTPEQLAVAARALGVSNLMSFPDGDKRYWCTNTTRIGSDADLFDKLLDTMTSPMLIRSVDGLTWYCSHDNLVDGNGPTKLAAVIACRAAMGAK